MGSVEYFHESSEWPQFKWDREALSEGLADVRHRQGRLLGHMEGLGFVLRERAVFDTLTQDVLKSSEIEGERLDAEQVRSSLARRLGVDIGALKPADRHVDGVVEMMLDATRRYDEPLTTERLCGWHSSLFPGGMTGMHRIRVGRWRDDATGPMQVISGPIGRERVHFEAPAAKRLAGEMRGFLKWLESRGELDPVWKAGVAHLWLVTLHPFDDGNGRIARAVADMALARSEKSPERFYSMSSQIQAELSAYYKILERTQKGTTDITPWMEWFVGCLGRAIDGARAALGTVLAQAHFWEGMAAEEPLNARQRLVITRLFEGLDGGVLTTSKYGKLAQCSQDTALRDILQLVERGVLIRGSERGRSTSYAMATRI